MKNEVKQLASDSAIRRAGRLAQYVDRINIATDLMDWCDKQRPQTQHGQSIIRDIQRYAAKINNES